MPNLDLTITDIMHGETPVLKIMRGDVQKWHYGGSGYIVSGVVTDGTNALSGVEVSIGAASAVTGENGVYILANVTTGTYTLSASKSGYTFTPITISVNGDITTNVVMIEIESPMDIAEQYFTARKSLMSANGGASINIGSENTKRCFVFAMPLSTYANAGYTNIKITFATGIQYIMGIGNVTSSTTMASCKIYDSSGNIAGW